MYSLVYASRRKYDFDITALVEKAADKNQRLNISGYLCMMNNTFFQYLEGDKEIVLALMDEIIKDDRHEVINTIETHFDERVFPRWHMRHVSNDKFSTVNLENVLQDILIKMQGRFYDKEQLTENTERLIKKIATRIYR